MAARIVYQEQLETLHNDLTEMANLCAQAVELAVQAVTTQDREAAQQTQDTDDIIDKKEQDIESLCLRLLLQQQPVASDMRHISSALKMITDLKRVGDMAADIAELSNYVTMQNGPEADDLREMADDVVKMVSESINAFIKNDLVLARDVKAWDGQADTWFVRIKEDLISLLTRDNTQAEYCLNMLMTANYLERIGDHTTNVAEWVAYSILGHHDS